ncbi:MAG: hypothetical protein GSR72_02350 [Desulfurococcales archaeon]|nr:hypothetical protein [Desulfurococcales archaeon]
MLSLKRIRSQFMVRIYGSIIGTVGFILSPASWWNDLVVNIPLALTMAKLASYLIGTECFDLLFVASYWVTNIVGILLMAYGYGKAFKPDLSRREILMSLIAASIYTVAAIIMLRFLGI